MTSFDPMAHVTRSGSHVERLQPGQLGGQQVGRPLPDLDRLSTRHACPVVASSIRWTWPT